MLNRRSKLNNRFKAELREFPVHTCLMQQLTLKKFLKFGCHHNPLQLHEMVTQRTIYQTDRVMLFDETNLQKVDSFLLDHQKILLQ